MEHVVSSVQAQAVLEMLMSMERHLRERTAGVPKDYQTWHDHCVVADVTLVMALQDVARLLPQEVREVVERLLAVRNVVLLREFQLGSEVR